MNTPNVNPTKICPDGSGPCEQACVGDDCLLVAVSIRKSELATTAAA